MGDPYLGRKAFKIFRRLEGQEPWCSHHSYLESWYNENVKDGSKYYRDRCFSAVYYLKNELTSSWSCINEVVVGGSLGKGTMIKDQSDIDLFVFMDWHPIDTIKSMRYKIQLKRGQEIAKLILERINGVTEVWSDDFVIHFKLEYDEMNVRVDLLLTADNSHDGDMRSMTEAMLRKSDTNREYYSACLVKQRQHFIKSERGYVKELIRLVKTWAHAALPKRLKKSYFLELLTIYLWDEADEPARFDKAQALKCVLQKLAFLCDTNIQTAQIIYWCDDEDASDEAISELGMQYPILLDPTNPTNNVCKFLEEKNIRRTFSQAARGTLQTTLCRDVIVNTDWSYH